jgi:hypothetical protein
LAVGVMMKSTNALAASPAFEDSMMLNGRATL